MADYEEFIKFEVVASPGATVLLHTKYRGMDSALRGMLSADLPGWLRAALILAVSAILTSMPWHMGNAHAIAP